MKPSITGEQLREQRLEREAREAVEMRERFTLERQQAGAAMVLFGLALILVGGYFLIVAPGQEELLGRETVNLQRLFLGLATAVVGAVFASAGFVVRYQSS